VDLNLLGIANSPRVYRNILLFYWLVILILIVLEVVGLSYDSSADYIKTNIIMNTILLLAVIVPLQLLYSLSEIRNDYLLVVAGVLMACIIIYVNPKNDLVTVSYFLPYVVSIISLRRRVIIFTGALSVLSYILLHHFFLSTQAHKLGMVYWGALSFVIESFFISLFIAKWIYDLLVQLKSSTESSQELLIKTAIMEKLSKIDALTELYNHKTFHEYLGSLIQQCESYGLMLQLAIIDVDNFKKINDTYGHWVGDKVLVRIAATLKENCGEHDFICRYGGEEFAILFTEKTFEEAKLICELLRQKIAEHVYEELNGQKVTASFGLKEYRVSEGKETFFTATDAHLYAAKRAGKNRVVFNALL